MLVLTRKTGESLVITLPDGRQIDVSIVDVDRNKVRVGINAPRDVLVNRREVQEEIDRKEGGNAT